MDARGRVILPASPLAIANDGVVNRIVDRFVPMSFTDSAGTTLEFRLFLPAGYRSDPGRARTYPLVTFLHGAGETGSSNITQLTANQGGVAFAKPERQRTDPSFVLAPQLPPPIRDFPNNNWALPARQNAVIELIDAVAAAYPVDQDRLYLTGLSMGAFGTYGILPNHPDKFAGAIAIAGRELNGDLARIPLFRDVAALDHAFGRRPDRLLHARVAGHREHPGGRGRGGHAGQLARQPRGRGGRGAGARSCWRPPGAPAATRCSRRTRPAPRRSTRTSPGSRRTSTTR